MKLTMVVEDVWPVEELKDECGHVGCKKPAEYCVAIHAGRRDQNKADSVIIALCPEHTQEATKCLTK
jgi:hypothetical protein